MSEAAKYTTTEQFQICRVGERVFPKNVLNEGTEVLLCFLIIGHGILAFLPQSVDTSFFEDDLDR